MGSNSIISSRLVQRMISDPAIPLQLEEAQLPNQAIGLFRTSAFASSLRVATTS